MCKANHFKSHRLVQHSYKLIIRKTEEKGDHKKEREERREQKTDLPLKW